MSQTLTTTRDLRLNYHGHKHKIHLIVIEDCDADDHDEGCLGALGFVDASDTDRMWEAVKQALGFESEKTQ
jgi:hypothetical protein